MKESIENNSFCSFNFILYNLLLFKNKNAKIKVVKINEEKNYSICQIKIHEGRNRQVRKMCRAINHPVLRLRRAAMGKIVLKDLEVGQYRHLTKEEVAYLKSIK